MFSAANVQKLNQTSEEDWGQKFRNSNEEIADLAVWAWIHFYKLFTWRIWVSSTVQPELFLGKLTGLPAKDI